MFSAGPGGIVAYLTNQPTVTQCSTATGTHGSYSVSCGSPVTAPIQPGGVFIQWYGQFLDAHAPTSPNRVLDGHPATVQAIDPHAAECLSGATKAVRMTIWLPLTNATPPGSGQSLTMTACYTGPNTQRTAQDLNALIDSVTFT